MSEDSSDDNKKKNLKRGRAPSDQGKKAMPAKQAKKDEKQKAVKKPASDSEDSDDSDDSDSDVQVLPQKGK